MIVKKEKSENVVFDYNLKEFPLVVSKPAKDFVSKQEEGGSDFKISELIAEQSGMSELQRKSMEAKVEEMALHRLKEIEERAYKEAYDLGKIEGTEKAFEERKAEFEDRLSKFDELISTFHHIKEKIMKENEVGLVKLMYFMAEKIALKEIGEDKENIMRIIMQIIEDVQVDERMILYVNPEDAQFINGLMEKRSKEIEALQKIKLEQSPEIDPGGCSLETNFGTIDASIQQRVSKVWEAMVNKMPRLKGHNVDLKEENSATEQESKTDDDNGDGNGEES